jgi:hypothetical protein
MEIGDRILHFHGPFCLRGWEGSAIVDIIEHTYRPEPSVRFRDLAGEYHVLPMNLVASYTDPENWVRRVGEDPVLVERIREGLVAR